MRTRLLAGSTLAPLVAAALLFTTESGAQTPSDPAGAPPTPDAVSGSPSPSENPSVTVPVPPPTTAAEPAKTEPSPTATPTTPVVPAAPEEPGKFTRRGFYFSGGIGTSIVNYQLDQHVGDALVYAGGITELVPATMLKIGVGVGDQTAVHFTNRIAWLNHNDPAAVDHHERIWTMSSMSGVGVTHFLDRDRRSWYIGADLGVSQWLAFEDIELDLRDLGIGACLEIGSAFFKGLSFEHSVCWGSVTSERRGVDGGTEIDAELGMPLTASFTVNYLK